MSFTLPELNYSYDALEPHFDAKTMEIHHTKHHQTYTDNLNKIIASEGYGDLSIEEILEKVNGNRFSKEDASPAIRNNGGGYYNHKLFWEILDPKDRPGNAPVDEVKEKIDEAFGSFTNFKEEFAKAATTRFGSGWAWLCKKEDGSLAVISTANQDNPLMPIVNAGKPILGLDVWEHAYYLKFQNRRPKYINAFWDVVNWRVVNEKFHS